MRRPLALSLLLLLTAVILAPAQRSSRPPVDVNILRSALTTTFGDHLIIVKDELVTRSNWHGGGKFWLVYVQPKHTGYFAVKYRYNYNGSLYSHVERELPMRVGPKGCKRKPLGNGNYGRFCLGDTIILPIVIDKFTEHDFSLNVTTENVDDENITDSSSQNALLSTPHDPVSDHLRYIEGGSTISLKRAGGYTLEYFAVFEGQKPGRFNLSLTSGFAQAASSNITSGGFPVIVIARETPITAVVSHDHVEGFSRGFNGTEYSSSSGGNDSYLTDVLILQTGDRFSFTYQSESHSAKEEWQERAENKLNQQKPSPPKITKLPFSLNKDWGFNEWIAPHLPQ